ncbi:MAG: DUF6429 family protein [Oscillospiraceae bacterium]|nr:DUF6429 family protein [Oscillospiraceae bacterium]
MTKDINETIKDLTLMLLYLTSWNERDFENDIRRSWKGYDFGILNELTDENLIDGSGSKKSAYLYKEGIEKAEKLLSEYGIVIDKNK